MLRFSMALLTGMLIVSGQASAQSRSGGTSGGVSSGTLTTSQSTGGTSGLSSGAGTSTLGGGGGGGGGRGASAQQGTQLGQTQSQFNMGDGSLGQQIGQSGFVGQSNNQGFVGNRFSGQAGATQGTTPNFAGLQNTANQNARRNTTTSGTRQSLIRPQLRVDFTAPIFPVPELQSVAVERLSSLPNANGVQLSLGDGGVATLRGTVATENDRRVLEAFVRMEPGVRDVKNEVTVRP